MKTKQIILSAILFIVCSLIVPAQDVLSVLYFENIAGSNDYAWLSKGITDSLISTLASNEEITVVERTRLEEVIKEQKLSLSGMTDEKHSLEIGNLLNANKIISGSYIIAGGTLQVNCRITDAETGKIVSGFILENQLADFTALQHSIANKIMIDLGYAEEAEIQPEAGYSVEIEAIQDYYSGLLLFDEGKYEKASEYFRESLKKDPFYNKPRETLQQCYQFLKNFREARYVREQEKLYAQLEAMLIRLYTTPFGSMHNLEIKGISKGLSLREINELVEENFALYKGATPAQLVWNIQWALFDIASNAEEYFEDHETSAFMYDKIVEISENARIALKNDPFLPEIIYSGLLSYSYTDNYPEMKEVCEELMIGWPDFRMMWAVEDFYEKVLENME